MKFLCLAQSVSLPYPNALGEVNFGIKVTFCLIFADSALAWKSSYSVLLHDNVKWGKV